MGYEIFSFWTDDEFPEDTNLEIVEQYGLGKKIEVKVIGWKFLSYMGYEKNFKEKL